MRKIFNVFRDELGATAIEYGLIAGLVALGVAVGATQLGKDLTTGFKNLGQQVLKWLPAAGE